MKIEIPGKTYKQITKLDLSNKNLIIFPIEILKCTNLRKLILSNNSITQVPKEITLLLKLKVIDLSHNKIKQLYAYLFKLPQLETLNVSYNEIKTLPRQINESGIKNLLVQNNNISGIDEKVISKLEKLNISHNQLSSFAIKQSNSNLKILWINDNPIKIFQINQQFVPYLKEIHAYTKNLLPNCTLTYKSLAEKKGNSFDLFITTQDDITRNLEPNIKNKKLNIFISYAHDDDKKWIQLLQRNLKALGKLDDKIESWDDTRIHAGDKWKEEIMSSLEKAGVAILLVSTTFLASDFIQDNELPRLLNKAKEDGTKIFSVILTPCLFEDHIGLSKYQTVNDPQKTLSECTDSERDRIMLKLMRDIKDCIEK